MIWQSLYLLDSYWRKDFFLGHIFSSANRRMSRKRTLVRVSRKIIIIIKSVFWIAWLPNILLSSFQTSYFSWCFCDNNSSSFNFMGVIVILKGWKWCKCSCTGNITMSNEAVSLQFYVYAATMSKKRKEAISINRAVYQKWLDKMQTRHYLF